MIARPAFGHPTTSATARLRRWWAADRRMTTAQRRRRRYAEGLEHAVERADRPWPFTAAVPVSREATEGARAPLLDIAERLRQPRPVTGEGLAAVRRLLTDGAGPLYYGPPGELRRVAQATLAALR